MKKLLIALPLVLAATASHAWEPPTAKGFDATCGDVLSQYDDFTNELILINPQKVNKPLPDRLVVKMKKFEEDASKKPDLYGGYKFMALVDMAKAECQGKDSNYKFWFAVESALKLIK